MERVPVSIITPEPVSGWLLVFCVLLTFVSPAGIFYGVFSSAIPGLLHSHTIKGEISCGIYLVLFTGVAVFSFIAGGRLWLIKPGAVRLTKRFLWTFLLAHVGYFALWFFLFQPVSSLRLAQMSESHIVGVIPYFYLWMAYLEHSKRVRETYMETLHPYDIPIIRKP
jgi:hypothetical protein